MSIVHTIGYEGCSVEAVVAALKSANVEVVADVRAVPRSRKTGFSKNVLAQRLEAEGIDYRHLAALGTPEEGRQAARSGRMDTFREVMESHLDSAAAQAALTELADLVRARPTCLLCFERDPQRCHRSLITRRLAAEGVEALHLTGGDG